IDENKADISIITIEYDGPRQKGNEPKSIPGYFPTLDENILKAEFQKWRSNEKYEENNYPKELYLIRSSIEKQQIRQIFIRVLINLCREYKVSKLALKILVFLQDIGINIDSTSYGVYHDILTETSGNKINTYQKKWRIAITVITTCFYMKNLCLNTLKHDLNFQPTLKHEKEHISKHSNISLNIKTHSSEISRNNCIPKTVLNFKYLDAQTMAKDFMIELQNSKPKNEQIFDHEFSLITHPCYHDNKEFFEIFMNSCHECHNCNCYLYDEQLLAGFSSDDSSSLTRCSYCQFSQLCNININIKFVLSFLLDLICNHINTLSIVYYSPLVVRAELEKIIKNHGSMYLNTDEFFKIYPTLFWNLIWYFKRLSLTSSFLYNLPLLLSLPQSAKFLIVCSWEKDDFETQTNRPLAHLHTSPLSGLQFENSVDFIKKVISPSLKAVQLGNIMAIVSNLMDHRIQVKDPDSKK
ncbi:hypothetical protein MXB_1898, partial [Myxobolus squamalis]